MRRVAASPVGWVGEVEYDPANHSHATPATDVTESLLRAAERVMVQIEALEVAKARVEADLIGAYEALHSIESQQIAAGRGVGSGVGVAQ